jgi:hypothetical protein
MTKKVSRVPVAHAYNTSYLGGRDQEDCGSKPAQANSSRDPISKKKKKTKTNHKTKRKKKSQKRTGRVAQGVGSEFKPQYCQKNKNKNKSGEARTW